jgi:hypothetical protein
MKIKGLMILVHQRGKGGLVATRCTVHPFEIFDAAGRGGVGGRIFLLLFAHSGHENNSFNVLFFQTNKYLS